MISLGEWQNTWGLICRQRGNRIRLAGGVKTNRTHNKERKNDFVEPPCPKKQRKDTEVRNAGGCNRLWDTNLHASVRVGLQMFQPQLLFAVCQFPHQYTTVACARLCQTTKTIPLNNTNTVQIRLQEIASPALWLTPTQLTSAVQFSKHLSNGKSSLKAIRNSLLPFRLAVGPM